MAKLLLAAASDADDDAIALEFCGQAEISLDRLKRPKSSTAPENPDHSTFREEVAAAYNEHAKFMARWKCYDKEQVSLFKCEKWRGVPSKGGGAPFGKSVDRDPVPFPEDIFAADIDRSTTIPGTMPEMSKHLSDTPQLAYCLAVLRTAKSPDGELPRHKATLEWFQAIENNKDEQERLKGLVKGLVRAFTRDELKDADAVAEVTYVAPVLERAEFRFLLKLFVNSLKDSALLEVHSLEGIACLMSSAPCTLEADDLVKTLTHINTILQATHDHSEEHVYKLITTVSRVLDAMADSQVVGLQRVDLHKPLYDYLDGLKHSEDPYMVFQAAYAFQALLRVPDDESDWEATVRRGGRILNGAFQLAGAVKALDVNSFIDGLCKLQTGFKEIYDVALTTKHAYEEAKSLYNSGNELRAALQEGFSFDRKRAWYPALRGTDSLLWNGQLAQFKKVVCEAPCRRALPFQWGVCLRLGNLAIDEQWDDESRSGAVAFLVELYKDDAKWGHHTPVKLLILDILLQLSKSATRKAQGIMHAQENMVNIFVLKYIINVAGANLLLCSFQIVLHRIAEAGKLLKTLEEDGTSGKQTMFRSCEKSGPSRHPLMAAMPPPSSSALLDRAQGIVDVEADLKRLRLACEKQRGETVYIPPMAKDSVQADAGLFDLRDKTQEFLDRNERKVLLLLGESGVGKSTFNLELERHLWRRYHKSSRIPLFISLPAIDHPEQDLIAKHLRKLQFEESQIRELRNRTFVLICDGYDESQQTHNLYRTNRLNEEGEWQAQMVISCRTEYLGLDYKDQFQPGTRNRSSDHNQFQEVVVVPFNEAQIDEYIKKFVALEKPLWSAEKYSSVLTNIPSLRELVKNPFLLKVSLDVLPRLVDPEWKNFAAVDSITRVALYDQFVEQWFERGKKRLVEKGMSEQERKEFEGLSSEGFMRNGIAFLKKLATAIYDNQGGNPVVQYSRVEDEGSWKEKLFGREDMQLLRDASPLARSGNQYRFIHRSILEYALARAVFEPLYGGMSVNETDELTVTSERRGSINSAYSFELHGAMADVVDSFDQGPDPESPLVRRSFVGEPSILQFLEERAQQEPMFKKQLRAFVEVSKTERKWRTAAANAITILVRAGVQFNGADLQGIQIPGADLSFGVFDSAQLHKADLRKAKLSNIWLRKAILIEARMSGAEFGELPYLQEDDSVSHCIYSPDGKTLISFGRWRPGGANVYSTSTWEKKWTLGSDIDIDSGITFSPDSTRIASFNKRGNNAQLWATDTGTCLQTLQGHTSPIREIAYSPNNGMIATCSNDQSIRLWDTGTGSCSRILKGHELYVVSIAFSPKGDRLVSGDGSGQVFLWNLKSNATYEIIYEVDNHHAVRLVRYTPTGTKIVIIKEDALLLLDLQATTSETLCRCDTIIQEAAFSPKGDSIAVIKGYSGEVHIWNTETAELRRRISKTKDNKGYLVVAFSSKGDLIATGGTDQVIRLWDVETGICRSSMAGHSGEIRSVAFSPNGRQVASSSDDMQVRLWEVQSGTTRTSLSGLSLSVLSIGRSQNGHCIISANREAAVNVWDMQSGEYYQYPTDQGAGVCSVAHSPRTHQFASGGVDGKIQLWSAKTGVCHNVLGSHDNAVNCVTYSPSGDQIASCSEDKSVRIWDVKTGECQHNFSFRTPITMVVYSPRADQFAFVAEHKMTITLWGHDEHGISRELKGHLGGITSITYSPTGDEIASTSNDKTVRLWDTGTGKCRLVLDGHTDRVYQAVYCPHGNEIASCSKDGSIRLWNVRTGMCRSVFVGKDIDGVQCIAYSPVGGTIATREDSGTVRLWNVETGLCLSVLSSFDRWPEDSWDWDTPQLRQLICYSPRGDLIAANTGDLEMTLWDVGSLMVYGTFKNLIEHAAAHIFSPNGSHIACLEDKAVVQLWNLDTRTRHHTLRHEGMVYCIQYSPKGDLLAISDDKSLRLWDAETGTCLHTMSGYRSLTRCLSFSPKGDRLVHGCIDNTVRMRSTTLEIMVVYGFGGGACLVLFSPNGRQLASGILDAVVLWDLETSSFLRVFHGHTACVTCIAFSPKGNHIASGSDDKSNRLWDIETGSCRCFTTYGMDQVSCLVYSPNGELIAAGSHEMSVWLWDVASGHSRAIIEGGYGSVGSIAWVAAKDGNYLVTGGSDSSVRVWRVTQEEGKPCTASVTLHWSSSHRVLFVTDCDLQGVKGLSSANKRLLKQRKASGEPEPPMNLNNVTTVPLAAFKFRQSIKPKVNSPTFASAIPQPVALEE